MLTLRLPEETEMSPSLVYDNAKESQVQSTTMSKCDSETNSSIIIGSPLQTSSPSTAQFRPTSGNGDGHSLRSVNNMLSPIHCLRATRHKNSSMDETPPSSSLKAHSASETLDSFLTNYESSSSAKPLSNPNSLEQELLLTEKISVMEEGEAKKLLTKVLVDNVGLRQELRTKDKRITAYKGQMLAILDWKARQDCDGESNDRNNAHATRNHFSMSNEHVQLNSEPLTPKPKGVSFQEIEEREVDSKRNMIPQKVIHNSQEITMVEEVYGIRRSLSYIQDFASSIDVDHEMLKDRLKDGYYLTNQLVVGGIAGWMSALFVKKFGKLALSATGGGLILLVYTVRKGYVNVNYDSIYQEISKFCDDADGTALNGSSNDICSNDSDANGSSSSNREESLSKSRDNLFSGGRVDVSSRPREMQEMCAYDKVRHVKNWITSHTYTVGGFVVTFVYNLI